VSWSLLTVHTNPALALQLMRGSYNGQLRPLTSKTQNFIAYISRLHIPETLTIRFKKHNLDQGYF